MLTGRNEKPQTDSTRRPPGLLAWVVPILAVAAVTSGLAASYLGGTLNPTDNLADFPIAIVNEDTGATLPTGQELTVGEDIRSGLISGLDADKFEVRELSLAQAQEQMSKGTLYGALVLPETLSADIAALGQSALTPDIPAQPTVQVLTNPRVGTFAANIVSTVGRSAFESANSELGSQLLAQVQQIQAARGSSAALSGAATGALASPLLVEVGAFAPLPDGTGSGLSAFYYALILILAGFSGSLVANAFIDSRLGFVPFEFGPVYRMEQHSGYSRTRTLIAKWAVMAVIAVVVSAVYLGISSAMGMPIDRPWELWAFGALAIAGVAVVCQTINALLGNVGLIVNLFIMIVLALPSAGATIPLEATPEFFRWLATFEPLHQIYAGTRSILYLDGAWDTGTGQGVTASVIAVVVGLVVGLIGTRFFDYRGYIRGPAAVKAALHTEK